MTYELTSHAEEPAQAESPQFDIDSWDGAMAALRDRFPKASDGILFCVFKLQQNHELTIRDFRDEAELHGVKIGGRAFHSAKVLLGMEQPVTRKPRTPAARRDVPLPALEVPAGADMEATLIQAVQQIQESATTESQRLRDAMRKAIEVLQRALDGRESE